MNAAAVVVIVFAAIVFLVARRRGSSLLLSPEPVSASSLLNASNLGQPLVVEFARARQNEKHGIFTHLVAAGVAAAVLMPTQAECMGKKRKKDSVRRPAAPG